MCLTPIGKTHRKIKKDSGKSKLCFSFLNLKKMRRGRNTKKKIKNWALWKCRKGQGYGHQGNSSLCFESGYQYHTLLSKMIEVKKST